MVAGISWQTFTRARRTAEVVTDNDRECTQQRHSEGRQTGLYHAARCVAGNVTDPEQEPEPAGCAGASEQHDRDGQVANPGAQSNGNQSGGQQNDLKASPCFSFSVTANKVLSGDDTNTRYSQGAIH